VVLGGLLAGQMLGACVGRSLPEGAQAPAGLGGANSGVGGGSFDDWRGNGGSGRASGGSGVEPSGAGGQAMSPVMNPVSNGVDAGGQETGASCADLEAQYVTAVEEAKACDPTSTLPQCALIVIPSLCGGCSTYVNSTAAPYAVRGAWDLVPCPVPPRCGPFCPAGPSGARCVPTGGGAGRCTDVAP
jgi:hypothetical protein